MSKQTDVDFSDLDMRPGVFGDEEKRRALDGDAVHWVEGFLRTPRSYAMALVEDGLSARDLLLAVLYTMSHDEVRGMLDANELSPRFALSERRKKNER